MGRFVLKAGVRLGTPPSGMFTADEYAAVSHFYRTTPATPLHRIPVHGIGELIVKDETSRLGLNAFKILGVRFALSRLREEGRLPHGSVLTCATDGNHGRAVARVAAAMGLTSRVYVPKLANEARRRAIADEGAELVVVDGNYDDAVHLARADAQANDWHLISDTSWEGYSEIPRLIMLGYTHILEEASRQWSEPPDVVFAHGGVGGFACAVGSWFAYKYGQWRPFLICSQPEQSPCLLEAARRGTPQRLEGSLETVMDCLSAGEVSHAAWPVVHSIYDAYVGVTEEAAVEAVQYLQQHSIISGYSGACSVAALHALLSDDSFQPVREVAGLNEKSRVLAIVTEGVTA